MRRIGKAESYLRFQAVFRSVVAVPALVLHIPDHGSRERSFACRRGYIVGNAVFVVVIVLLKGSVLVFPSENKFHARIYHCLPVQHRGVVFLADIDIGENLGVGLPVDRGLPVFFCPFW